MIPLRRKIRRAAYLGLQRFRIAPKNPYLRDKVERQFNFFDLFSKIAKVDGAVVELGVSWGAGLTAFKILIEGEGKHRELYGFDTFEGLPDSKEERSFKGQFGASEGEVRQFFVDCRVPLEGVHFVSGDIRDTLARFDKPIAFMHVDLDLYEPYKVALEIGWDKIVPGGVVLFDDYGMTRWSGATRAVDEFVAAKGLTLLKSAYANRAYLIKP